MTTDKKLYIALGVLVVLGGALFLQNKQEKEEATAYSLEGRTADLPKLELTDEKVKGIDKITITEPASEAGAPREFVLEKKGEEWSLTKPAAAKANDANVKSLLDNLKTLKVAEAIDPGADQATYDKWCVSDGKALHAVSNKGKDVVAYFYFGQDGSRGQMTRVAGKNGVYAVKGYSSFLYSRDLKGWRDLTLFKFESDKVKTAEIKNEHGTYTFTKDKGVWTARYAGKGKLDKFDESKLKDMLRAYENLNADGFADGKTPADTGLDKPAATVTLTLEDGGKREIQIGKTAEGSSRWAKKSDSAEIVSISSYAADWATAEPSKFNKPSGDAGAAPDPAAMGMPPGMPGMPPGMPHGMPPGHP